MPWRNSLIFLCLLLCAVAFGQDQARIKEQELQEVREKIKTLQAKIARQAGRRDKLSAELGAAEIEIAETSRRLAAIDADRNLAERRIEELDRLRKKQRSELARQQTLLAAQVRSAYTSGRQERVKMMLNQHDPAMFGRTLVYYRYLNEVRSNNITAVNQRLQTLAAYRRESGEKRDQLDRLAAEKTSRLDTLTRARTERSRLLAAVTEQLKRQGQEVKSLQQQEKDLSRLIAELAEILADYPVRSEEPFSALKGKLTWPVAGQLRRDFGQPRANGRLKWNGVLFSAPRGREVRALYHGRVAYADWLPGLGLLVIIEHGEGYLSLYGHNDALLKSSGDWVAPGDAIAAVGDSGGQAQTGLYFEIRKGKRPVNPRHWISKSPKSP